MFESIFHHQSHFNADSHLICESIAPFKHYKIIYTTPQKSSVPKVSFKQYKPSNIFICYKSTVRTHTINI